MKYALHFTGQADKQVERKQNQDRVTLSQNQALPYVEGLRNSLQEKEKQIYQG